MEDAEPEVKQVEQEDANGNGKTSGAGEEKQEEFGEVIEDDDDEESQGSEDSMDEKVEKLKTQIKEREEGISKLKRNVWNKDPDKRTLYVGNVDLSTLPEELYFGVFASCGPISKIIIHTDFVTSLPSGFAYVEFEDLDGAEAGLKKHGLNWRGIKLQICPKVAPAGQTSSIKRLDAGLSLGLPLRTAPPLSFGKGGKGSSPFAGGPVMAGGKGGKGGPMNISSLAGPPLSAGGSFMGGKGGKRGSMFAPY